MICIKFQTYWIIDTSYDIQNLMSILDIIIFLLNIFKNLREYF